MVLYTAKPLLSLPMLLSLDPFPYYSQCDICTLCYVDMCQCVYVCVCVRVFFSAACVSRFWLGAEPRLMIGSLPLWCHGVLSAGMRKPLCSPARECSCLRVPTSFPLWMKLVSCSFLWNPVHPGGKHCLTLVGCWSSFPPCVFRGNLFFRQRECFLWKKGLVAWLRCAAALRHKDRRFPPAWPFLPSSVISPSSARHLDSQSLSVAAVNMQ